MESRYLHLMAPEIALKEAALALEHKKNTGHNLSINWKRDGSQAVVKLTTDNQNLLDGEISYEEALALVSADDWPPLEEGEE